MAAKPEPVGLAQYLENGYQQKSQGHYVSFSRTQIVLRVLAEEELLLERGLNAAKFTERLLDGHAVLALSASVFALLTIGTGLADRMPKKDNPIFRRFVMKKLLLPLPLAAMLTFTAGIAAPGLQVRLQPPETQQPVATQQPTAQQNDMQTQEAKAFNGTIMKEKGKLVLRDNIAKISYQLDDQEKAKQFEGKQVKVTGKLDLSSNLIHVDNIELAS